MNLKKIQSVSVLSDEGRLDYFIRKVTDFEELWGSYDNGWTMLGSDANEKVIPFWPEEDFAQAYIDSNQLSASPKKIELGHFLEKWIPGMEKDGAKINVFPVSDKNGVVITPNSLAEFIKNEMEQYE